MIERYYECFFKSDIVLQASSNTQGNILLSDFIAGSNFLGMVAQAYDSFGDNSFEVFHSGAVKFGDAHIVIEDKVSYKMPLCFHNLKVGHENYNRLHLSEEREQELRNSQKQLKQLRSGFINDALSFTTPIYNYSQKSSYDKKNRHSQESGMFGYSALQAGTKWQFKVNYSDEKYIAQVEKNLLGNKKLGKSKTAQYGAVTITKLESSQRVEQFLPKENLTYLYVNSRLALMDKNGDATMEPTIENLGLESGEIVWKKSFIQTSTYTSYNYKRQTDEYTRLCINKGSVITIKGLQEKLENSFYVGAFLSEGFGEILVNPSFLESTQLKLNKINNSFNIKTAIKPDDNLVMFLQEKQQEEESKFEVATHVQDVYERFIGPSKSQWGEIRSFCATTQNANELIEKIQEYISHGTEKKQWENIESKLVVEIEKSSSPIAFVKLLAMIVSKHTKGGNNE